MHIKEKVIPKSYLLDNQYFIFNKKSVFSQNGNAIFILEWNIVVGKVV